MNKYIKLWHYDSPGSTVIAKRGLIKRLFFHEVCATFGETVKYVKNREIMDYLYHCQLNKENIFNKG